MIYFKLFIFSCFVFLVGAAYSQSPAVVDSVPEHPVMKLVDTLGNLKITSIEVIGNKRTKTYIVLREIHFKPGDSLVAAMLATELEQARRQVYNLNLFSEVEITPLVLSAYDISVRVTVREKWYIYPTPQFQLVDRNINEWLKTYNADFNRVIYGLKFIHYNFSGRGDQLHVYLLNGYARNFAFNYNAPYSNSKLTEGFRVTAAFTQNREISYKTNYYNKLLQYKREDFVRENFSASISYQSRKGFFKKHQYFLSYNYVNLYDSITGADYNPNYLNTVKPYKGFLELAYAFQYANTDNINYPLVGKTYRYTLLKRGLGLTDGINMLSLEGTYSKYLSHFNHKLYSSIQVFAKVKIPFKQPYINQRALGYGDTYLRGLEYYVIDGVAAAMARYTIKKKLFAFNIPVPFNIKAVPRIPFTFFAKTYADAGYSYIERQFDSRLNNRLLYTGGFGLDILTLYDINLNLEYSFNQLGENGLFLHTKGGF